MGRDRKDERGIGDLLGDPEWLAAQPRQLEDRRGLPMPEHDPDAAFLSLARLSGADPDKAQTALKKGGPLAQMLRYLLGMGCKKRGPKPSNRYAERWAVVHWLQSAGYEGEDLDRAIMEVARPNVTLDHYRRSAARFSGSPLVALFLDTDAVAKARSYPSRSQTGE